MAVHLHDFSLERIVNAAERTRQRLLKTAAALEAAAVPFAVVGDDAVALWVSRVDESAVRNTQDVDILINRASFDQVKTVLESAGFVYRHAAGMDLFLDGPNGRPRDAVHLVFAGEMVRAGEALPNPQVDESEMTPAFRVLALGALVRIKLTAFRDKDRMHLRDLIDVGLLDGGAKTGLPDVLGRRLQQLLDDPNG